MSFILLGILNAQAEVADAGAYDLLETTVLGSSASSVTFDNLDTLAAGYKHLQIRAVTKTDRTDNNLDSPVIQFNADTAGNYVHHFLEGNGSSVGSGGNGNFNSTLADGIYSVTTASNTTNSFGASLIDLLDPFDTTKNTTARILSGTVNASNNIRLVSGLWLDTSSLTSITIKTDVGPNFITGSRFSLYGIK